MTKRIRQPVTGRPLLAIAILAAVALIALGCSNGGSDEDPTETPAEVAGAPTDAMDNGGEATVAVDRLVVDVDGGDVELFVYTGADELGGEQLMFADVFASGKPIVLNFWAGLCPPCRQEMPDFQTEYETRDDFVMFGVDVGPFTGLGDSDDARDLLDELGITYPTAYVESDELMRDYNVFGMPTTVFLTADGTIVSEVSGFLSADDIHDAIEEMVDASS